jgi:hypothetical protein
MQFAFAAVGCFLACAGMLAGCDSRNPMSGRGKEDAATVDAAIPRPRDDEGLPDAASIRLDAATDGSNPASDASVDCTLHAGSCPRDCLALVARRYNQERGCIDEAVSELVGCVPAKHGVYDDPRCARRISTGEIFRVPLSFLDRQETTPSAADWTSCSDSERNRVSSTLTPGCDDLEDGGIYDGAI